MTPNLLGTLRIEALESALKSAGIRVAVGPFVISIRGDVPDFVPTFLRCYADYPMIPADTFADARVTIERDRRFFNINKRASEASIRLNEGTAYTKFPIGSELPYMEWGINLCIATRAHQYLMLHAGVLEKNGMAMLLPGLPGSGKSTLCTYLMHRGWRLLSDEFTLLSGPNLRAHPFPRLVPLKNESIDVIRAAVPNAKIGPSFDGTPKGTVAHVCPPAAHIARMAETATPGLIVFPQYKSGAATELALYSKPGSFVELTKHAFNYILRGRSAFEMTTALVDNTACYRLVYSDLLDAEQYLNQEISRLEA